MPGYSVSTYQAAMQPYSISASFDLGRPWRIAVLPPTADVPGADNLTEYAGLQLMKVTSFSVVDRLEVDRILREQQFSCSGMVDPATASRLGKLMGASAVMAIKVGTVKHDEFWDDNPNQRDAELMVRIISVETAEVLYSAQGSGTSLDGAEEALQGAVTTALMPLLEKGGAR
jgi:hypothetical protein